MGASFSGGEKVRERLRELAALASSASGVKMGFLEGSHAGKDNRSSAPEVAVYLEMGTSSMPPRPFFQETVDEKREEWGAAAQKLIVANGYDMQVSMDQLGKVMSANLRDHMTAFTDPADKPETIKRKGFDKTLIDSANLRNAINHEVLP